MKKRKSTFVTILLIILIATSTLFKGITVKAAIVESKIETRVEKNIMTEDNTDDVKTLQIGGVLIISLVIVAGALSEYYKKHREY